MGAQTLDTAKIFTTGRSQAVRLPKAYRFTTKEVSIERQGDAVILRPRNVKTKEEFWAEMDKILEGFEGFEPIEREHSDLREPVKFDAS